MVAVHRTGVVAKGPVVANCDIAGAMIWISKLQAMHRSSCKIVCSGPKRLPQAETKLGLTDEVACSLVNEFRAE